MKKEIVISGGTIEGLYDNTVIGDLIVWKGTFV